MLSQLYYVVRSRWMLVIRRLLEGWRSIQYIISQFFITPPSTSITSDANQQQPLGAQSHEPDVPEFPLTDD